VKTKLFASIPSFRLVLYALLAPILITCIAIFWMHSIIGQKRQEYERLGIVGETIQKKLQNQRQNQTILETFTQANQLFLHNNLEQFSALSQEIEKLQKKGVVLPEDRVYEKRLEQIRSDRNKFHFVEESTTISPHYKEIIEKQRTPVELDNKDLTTILQILDTQQEEKPHLIITEASIERKKAPLQEVWVTRFTILRREYQS